MENKVEKSSLLNCKAELDECKGRVGVREKGMEGDEAQLDSVSRHRQNSCFRIKFGWETMEIGTEGSDTFEDIFLLLREHGER